MVRRRGRSCVEGAGGTLTLDPASDYHANRLTVATGDVCAVSCPGGNQFAAMLDELADAVR